MTAELTRDEEVRRALETIFAADSEIYQTRGFQRRIGFGTRPALLIIDLANAWTKPGHNFTCDNMEVIIPTNQQLLAAAREKNIPVIYTTTAYQDPTGPHADTGLWHMKISGRDLARGLAGKRRSDERIEPMQSRGEQVIVKKRASARSTAPISRATSAPAASGHGDHHRRHHGRLRAPLRRGCDRRGLPPHRRSGRRGRPGARGRRMEPVRHRDAKFGDVEPAERVLAYLNDLEAFSNE